MYPKILEIPALNLTIWTYGVFMVIGFVSAVLLIRHLSRDITPNSQLITNAALYSLIAGVVGARVFYVIHYFDGKFRGNLIGIFKIWEGGLELLGGVILAITVISVYLRYHKLPARRYLDILAVALMLALAVGRIGCFMYGCCYGKPTDLPWAVRFPYAAPAYVSQVYCNHERNRAEPQLILHDDFFDSYNNQDSTVVKALKSYDALTEEQKKMVENGPYRCLPVHPTQLYASANAVILCLILYLFWRRTIRAIKTGNQQLMYAKPGCTFALMFILYGITRFLLEFVRDDNPFGFMGLTISQNIGIVIFLLGIILMVVFGKMGSNEVNPSS